MNTYAESILEDFHVCIILYAFLLAIQPYVRFIKRPKLSRNEPLFIFVILRMEERYCMYNSDTQKQLYILYNAL